MKYIRFILALSCVFTCRQESIFGAECLRSVLSPTYTYKKVRYSKQMSQMALACETCDLNAVQTLLRDYPWLAKGQLNDNGETGLILATKSNYRNVAERQAVIATLLNNGANINAYDAEWFSAFHYAAKIGDKDLMNLYLYCGGNPNQGSELVSVGQLIGATPNTIGRSVLRNMACGDRGLSLVGESRETIEAKKKDLLEQAVSFGDPYEAVPGSVFRKTFCEGERQLFEHFLQEFADVNINAAERELRLRRLYNLALKNDEFNKKYGNQIQVNVVYDNENRLALNCNGVVFSLPSIIYTIQQAVLEQPIPDIELEYSNSILLKLAKTFAEFESYKRFVNILEKKLKEYILEKENESLHHAASCGNYKELRKCLRILTKRNRGRLIVNCGIDNANRTPLQLICSGKCTYERARCAIALMSYPEFDFANDLQPRYLEGQEYKGGSFKIAREKSNELIARLFSLALPNKGADSDKREWVEYQNGNARFETIFDFDITKIGEEVDRQIEQSDKKIEDSIAIARKEISNIHENFEIFAQFFLENLPKWCYPQEAPSVNAAQQNSEPVVDAAVLGETVAPEVETAAPVVEAAALKKGGFFNKPALVAGAASFAVAVAAAAIFCLTKLVNW